LLCFNFVYYLILFSALTPIEDMVNYDYDETTGNYYFYESGLEAAYEPEGEGVETGAVGEVETGAVGEVNTDLDDVDEGADEEQGLYPSSMF
jgi:hypothetical protein